MKTIWKLIDTCLIPTLLYATETWTTTKNEIKHIQTIFDNIIKRILKTPTSTPSEIIQLETGFLSIESMIHEKQLMYYHRIHNINKCQTTDMATNPKTPWNTQMKKILTKYNLQHETIINMKKTQLKKPLKHTINKANLNNILTQANNKSKLRDLISYKSPENMEKTPTYMKELTRTECTGIFAIRSRMVKTKSNYKTQHNDQKCRWCITELETQNHIITKCPKFKDLTINQSIYFRKYKVHDT